MGLGLMGTQTYGNETKTVCENRKTCTIEHATDTFRGFQSKIKQDLLYPYSTLHANWSMRCILVRFSKLSVHTGGKNRGNVSKPKTASLSLTVLVSRFRVTIYWWFFYVFRKRFSFPTRFR